MPGHKRKRCKQGGKRPGSGRKMLNHERIWGTISRDTRVKLDRYARQHGLTKEIGKAFWEKVLNALLGKVELKEPEYLILANSITVRQVV